MLRKSLGREEDVDGLGFIYDYLTQMNDANIDINVLDRFQGANEWGR